MTDHSALIERLERDGASRELDADLWWMLDHRRSSQAFHNAAMGLPRPLDHSKPIPDGMGKAGVRVSAPAFTTSLDAITGAIDRALPRCRIAFADTGSFRGRKPCWGEVWSGDIFHAADADTRPLALCIALLLALAAAP